MGAARDFLSAWTTERSDRRSLSHEEAAQVASQWEADAADNGISHGDLAAAADGDLTAYILRIFGEKGDEFSTDGGENNAPTQPPEQREDYNLF